MHLGPLCSADPNFDTLRPGRGTGMDLLSRVLSGFRVQSPLIALISASDPVSIDMMGGHGFPFHYVISGSMEVELEGRREQVTAGDLVMFPNWPKYILHVEGGSEVHSIMDYVRDRDLPVYTPETGLDVPLQFEFGQRPFKVRILCGYCYLDANDTSFLTASLPKMIRAGLRNSPMQASLDALWDLALRELVHVRPGFSAVSARGLELLIVQALRIWFQDEDQALGWTSGLRHPNVRKALQAMHEEPGRPWTMAQLADVAGQSRSAFAVAFKETMDETPFSHLRRLRIYLASNWLKNGRKSLAEIAEALGYGSAHSFARAFHDEMGQSAAAYRRSQRRL